MVLVEVADERRAGALLVDRAGACARAREGIAALLPHAREAGKPLAIEPLHPMYAADRACVKMHRTASIVVCLAGGYTAAHGWSHSCRKGITRVDGIMA